MEAQIQKPVVSQNRDILDEIQKKIYGQRVDKISPIEINKLFQSPITAEFNLTIYKALERGVINPDVTILQAIPRALTKDYLIPIALCLRYGADPNMYVNAPKIGTIHILGYVYNVLSSETISENVDPDIINTIILMLIIEGARPSFPMYDIKGGRIRNDGTTSSSPSVAEWLSNEGYSTILDRINVGDISEIQKIVDDESLNMLSILLDNPSINKKEYEKGDILLAIRAFSNKVMEKTPFPDNIVMLDYKSLDDAVSYLNSMAFEILIRRGQIPSYLLINKILIGIKGYKNMNKNLAVQELEKMLLVSISIGVQLDQDQLSIIGIMGNDILSSVTREYEQPYWKKICKNPNLGQPTDELRRLALSLNLDPSMNKASICESLNILSKSDKETLKEAARQRQQLRLTAEMGNINDFLGGKTPTLICRNRSLLPNDPFDYNDIDIAYYKDDQGTIWCFTSDSFSNILESGINPYNSTALPSSFKEQLKHQIEILKRLGLGSDLLGIYTPRTPSTFSSSLDRLNNKDIINERNGEKILESFVQLALTYNISPETIRSLSKEKMTNALRSINYNVNLAPLSTSHALITTARIIEYINTKDPNTVRLFFESLTYQ